MTAPPDGGRPPAPGGGRWWKETGRWLAVLVAAAAGTVGANRVDPPAADRWTGAMQAQFVEQLHRDIGLLRMEVAALRDAIERIREINAEFEARIRELPPVKWQDKIEANRDWIIQHNAETGRHNPNP